MTSVSFDFTDQTVLITGASRGIGAATAQLFAQSGARVVVNYRADFGNDPYMDHGWIQNLINCHGYDANGQYNYLIVSDTDPRYTGNTEWSIWGTWEYHVLIESHSGNLVRPYNHAGG